MKHLWIHPGTGMGDDTEGEGKSSWCRERGERFRALSPAQRATWPRIQPSLYQCEPWHLTKQPAGSERAGNTCARKQCRWASPTLTDGL